MMLGGTLPVPAPRWYAREADSLPPLGVTVVFAAYVAGTLFALVALGDLSNHHIGRRTVLAIAVACAAAGAALFLAARPASGGWWRPGC